MSAARRVSLAQSSSTLFAPCPSLPILARSLPVDFQTIELDLRIEIRNECRVGCFDVLAPDFQRVRAQAVRFVPLAVREQDELDALVRLQRSIDLVQQATEFPRDFHRVRRLRGCAWLGNQHGLRQPFAHEADLFQIETAGKLALDRQWSDVFTLGGLSLELATIGIDIDQQAGRADQIVTGLIHVARTPQSLVARMWDRVVAVMIRESGL